ncbi:MAG: cytochrome c-type biogenesis CcmF C-terminal domain-containing protein, partial [Deltaproteobacteria bacterium]
KSLRIPTGLSLLTTTALVVLGVRDWLAVLFVFGSAFALFANLAVGMRIVKGNPKYAGGSIAHVGLAIMFLGFVASSKYDEKQTVTLPEGETVEAIGYKLTYTGFHPIDQEKYAFDVHVEKNGMTHIVSPIMYYSEYTKGLMRNPDIVNLISKDFYLAPLSLEEKGKGGGGVTERATLKRGETRKFGDLEVTFVDFDFPVMEKAAMLENRKVRIGAKLSVKEYGGKEEIVTPAKIIESGEQTDEPARFKDDLEFTIVGMRPDREARENSTVELGVLNLKQAGAQGNAPQRDMLVVEASVKPYINLVWSGVIILLVGFLVTIVRRAQEARLKAVPLAAAETPGAP